MFERSNGGRLRRTEGAALLLVGGIWRGWSSRNSGDMTVALWRAAGLKVMIAGAASFGVAEGISIHKWLAAPILIGRFDMVG